MINLALRFDDPSKTSNHQLESDIIRLLEKHQFPATFAVIPYKHNQDGTDSALAKQDIAHLINARIKNIIEVALHGYSHTNNGYLAKNSEFSGLSLKKQSQLIKMGRQLLDDIFDQPVTGFVPPWNSYDENTVLALKNLNFHYLSATWNRVGLNQSINLLPHTCNLAQLKIAVEEACILKHSPSILIAVLHHYNFKEHSDNKGIIDLNGFSALLDWINNQPFIRTVTLNGISEMYSPHELQKPIEFHEQFKNSHWRIRKLMPQHCLYPNKSWYFDFALSRLR